MSDSPLPKRLMKVNSMSRIEEDVATESWCTISSKCLPDAHFKVLISGSEHTDDSQGSTEHDQPRPMSPKRHDNDIGSGILMEESYSAPFVTSRLGSKRGNASRTSMSSLIEDEESYSNMSSVSGLSESGLKELGGIFDSLEIDHSKNARFRKEKQFAESE